MTEFPDPDRRLVVEPDCARCPALVDCRERIAWGVGPRDAAVMVVGEAPGAGDPDRERWRGGNWTGMVYTSAHSGRRIRATLQRAGYPDAYYTNAVKCFPAADPAAPPGEATNREPTDGELDRCRDHLLAELRRVRPAALVTTGKHATASVLAAEGRRVEGFLDLVLDPLDCPRLGTTVLPVVHPSYREVWIGRLGYEYDEYATAIGDCLDGVVAGVEG